MQKGVQFSEMMLNRVLLCAIAILVIFVPAAISQAPPQPAQDNLYSLALQASILQMEKEWGHIGYSALEKRIPVDYRKMIVEKDPTITDELPTDFEDHSIEYLDDKEIIQRYRKLNNSFEILKVGPIRNKGAVLKIVISTYWITYKKNNLQFAYSDWSAVEFRYDCEEGAFVIASVKLGGI